MQPLAQRLLGMAQAGCAEADPRMMQPLLGWVGFGPTSKIIFMRPDMAMISPLVKQSFLLSSST